MKITENELRRLIKRVLVESLDGTSWQSEEGSKITLRDVLDYFQSNNIMPKTFNTEKLFYKISGNKEVLNIVKKGGEESERRVKNASLEYPIIIVMRDREIKYVLDGNHRLQKAKNEDVRCVKVYVLDLDDPRTPDIFVDMF